MLQYVRDRAGGNVESDVAECAFDPLVTPAGVFTRHPDENSSRAGQKNATTVRLADRMSFWTARAPSEPQWRKITTERFVILAVDGRRSPMPTTLSQATVFSKNHVPTIDNQMVFSDNHISAIG